MKKNFKRVLVLLAVLLCFMTVVPNRYDKKADAVFAELTIAGGVAAGFGLPILLVGAAAAVAIGGVIGTNWESIADYGQRIWDDMEAKGQNPAGLVDETNNSVTMSPELINSAARTVDNVPVSVPTTGVINLPIKPVVKFSGAVWSGLGVSFGKTDSMTFKITGDLTSIVNSSGWFPFNVMGTYVSSAGVITAWNKQVLVTPTTNTYTFNMPNPYSSFNSMVITGATIMDTVNMTNTPRGSVAVAITPSYGGNPVYTADNFGMTADNVYQRELYANSMLSDNQVLTLNNSMDLTNATMEDVLSVQTNTYDETKTQTGILSNIWSTIKGIPTNIAAAGVAASLAINAKAEDLWNDAGAVWTGLADTAIGIKADVNTKMTALQDAMAGGIDNVRTNIDNMRLELGAGIDSLKATTATWFENVGVKIDTGIDALTGKLTDVWTGVSAIPAAIAAVPADIVTRLTDLAIPTAAQTAENNTNMSNTRLLLSSKFEWIRTPIEEIKSLYGQRRSFFDVSVVVMGQEVVLLPAAYAATVAVVRNVMSGTMIMMTIIFIYRRVQPTDVV